MIISYIIFKTKQFFGSLRDKIRQDYVNYLFRHFKGKEEKAKPNLLLSRKEKEKLLAKARLKQIAELEKSSPLPEHLSKRKEVINKKYFKQITYGQAPKTKPKSTQNP